MQLLRQENAAARAYRALEGQIVTLKLTPGSVVNESYLLELLGFGRTPTREAVQRLAWEGLIEIRPRSGLMIAPLVASDWLRVIDARVGPEIVLARSAARFLTPETSKLFDDAARQIKAAVETSDAQTFLNADKTLDEALAGAGDNPFAARIVAPLQTHSRRFWYRFHHETGLTESARHHLDIIAAVLSRDEDRADDMTRRLMAMLRLNAEAAITR